MPKKEIMGSFKVRAIVTFSVDEERSKQFGTTIRSTKHEKVLTPAELKEAIQDKNNPIHKYGFAILYAFDGKVDGRPLSFDTKSRAEYKTLGYAHAVVVGENKIFCHISLNEVPDYQRPSCPFDGFGYKSPDLLAGIKLEDIQEDAELKTREWKDKDFEKFPHKIMRTVNYEPGHFMKAASMILPPDSGIKNKNSMKKRPGRKADPDKEHMMGLPNKHILDVLRRWDENKSDNLNGFSIDKAKERSYLFKQERGEAVAKIRVSTSTRRIEIAYLKMVDDKPVWKLYKEWHHAEEIDEDAISKEILLAAKKLFGAFK